jgi:MFS family permease
MATEHSRAFRILFLCLTCIGTGQSMLFAILPPAAREIGLTPFQVSTIFATSASIWVFVSPRWGRQSDIWGRRIVIIIGLIGFAMSMGLLATMIYVGLHKLLPLSLVYPLMIASRCVFALVGSGTGPASQAYVADRTSRSERTAGVALVNAALGLGQTIGPGVGAALASFGLRAPLYFSSGMAVFSGLMIWIFLPEEGPPIEKGSPRPPRLSFRDPRVFPFLLIATSLQAVQATTSITLAFFMQDTLHLDAHDTVRYSGAGFVVFAVAGLFTQLVLVQRLKPSPRTMQRLGIPIALLAFATFLSTASFPVYLVALLLLGMGLGLVRPGNAAGASLAVEPLEQGSVAGLTNAIGVLGNVFGPMLGTTLFHVLPQGPYILNAVLMVLALIFVFTNPRLRRTYGA